MRQFITRLFIFLSISGVLYIVFSLFVLPKLLIATNGPNIQQQLQTSFKNAKKSKADLYIFGNSRMYCGVNPDMFNRRTYNFAHNNDAYNQTYHKLNWLFRNGCNPKAIILGVDYYALSVQSDRRNYAYGPLLGQEYLEDYKDKPYLLEYYISFLKPEKVRKLVKGPNYKQGLKSNGQYIRHGVPDSADLIKRSPKPRAKQISYFERILDSCKSRNMTVYLVMPPMRDVELMRYKLKDILAFEDFMCKHESANVHYLDYSRDSHYGMYDFVDFSHINQKAADKFSKQLNYHINLIEKSKLLKIPQPTLKN